MNTDLPPHLQKVLALADGTLTLWEMATVLGVTYYTVGNYMRVLRLLGHHPKILSERDAKAARTDLPTYLSSALKLADGSLTMAQIATLMGVKKKTVECYLRQLRKLGYHPATLTARVAVSRGLSIKQAARLTGQSLSVTAQGAAIRNDPIVRGLEPEIATWLVAQVPPGAHLYDTLRAIIRDAYHDEKC